MNLLGILERNGYVLSLLVLQDPVRRLYLIRLHVILGYVPDD